MLLKKIPDIHHNTLYNLDFLLQIIEEKNQSTLCILQFM